MSLEITAPPSLPRPLKRISLYAFAAVPLVVVPVLQDGWLTPKNVLFLMLGAFFCAWLLVADRPAVLSLPKWCLWFFSLFFLGALISTYNARYRLAALTMGSIYISCMIWTMVFVAMSYNIEDRNRCIALIVIQAIAQTSIGLVQVATSSRAASISRMEFLGTFGNPDFVATWLGVAFLMIFFSPAGSVRRRMILLLWIALGLVIADSRSAIFSVFITLMMFRKRRSHFLVLGFLVCVPLMYLASQHDLIIAQSWRHFFDAHTLFGRIHLWACALKMIVRSKGVGVGLDNFQFHFFEAQKELFQTERWDFFASNASMVRRAHNEYLDFLAEGGVSMFAAWLIFQLAVFKTISKKSHVREIRAFGAAFVFLSLDAMSSFPFHILPNLMLLGVVTAPLIALSLDYSDGVQISVQKVRPVAAVAALLLCSVAALTGLKEGIFSIAKINGEEGRVVRAEKWLNAGLVVFPGDRDLVCLLADLFYQDLDRLSALECLQSLHGKAESIDAWKLEGQILFDEGHWEQASAIYRMLEACFPFHITPKYQLGRIYQEQGRLDLAEAKYKQVIRLKPLNKKAVADQQDALARLGHKTRGERSLLTLF